MGEKHWGARAVHTLEKRHCQSASQKHKWSRRSGPGPKRKGKGGGGRGESVAAAQAPCQGTAKRAAGKRSLSPRACLKQLQHAAATRGDKPVRQLRRRRVHRVRCCVQDSSSFDGGGSRSMAPAQPHHVPLPSHALSLLAKTTFACNVVGAQVVPALCSSRRPSHRPFPSCCFDCLATSAAAAPDTAQGRTPALSLPLDTCLKIHLRYAG